MEFTIRGCHVGDEAPFSLLGKATFLETYVGSTEAADNLTLIEASILSSTTAWLESDFAKIFAAETAYEHSAIGFTITLASPFVGAVIEIKVAATRY